MSDRKKAIETLKQLRLDYEEFYEEHDNEVTNAYDMAISSLETDEAYDLMYEQPELCEDCISRKNILESLNGAFASTDWNKALFRKIVMDSPSVLPKADVPDKNVGEINDCISRKAVFDLIEHYNSDGLGTVFIDYRHGIKFADAINDLPSVKPQEPKTGHWIVQPSNEEQGERPFIWWKCSKCGQVIFSETEHDRLEFHAFCGRCGAKMIEPQKSEDKE